MSYTSWQESARNNAIKFVEIHKNDTYEIGDSQTFLNDFFKIFDLDRKESGAKFEVHPNMTTLDRIDLLWDGKLLVEMKSTNKDLDKAMNRAREYYSYLSKDQEPTHLLTCDFQNWYLIDKNTNNHERFTIQELPDKIGLFGFMIDKPTIHVADPVNEQAGKIMVDIYDSLIQDTRKDGNIEQFLTRTAFCLFADDTGVFESNAFQEYIKNTKQDGSDLGMYIERLFKVLNTPTEKRSSTVQKRFSQFQYIDGDLFKDDDIIYPEFTNKTRELLIKAGEYDWSKVSPVIFGSMFQNVMDSTARRNVGAHYTNKENILKVIKPLFLDELYKEYESIIISDDPNKLVQYRKLQDKLSSLTFFDPACGSGNFLSITYREIRRLEHDILYRIKLIDPECTIQSKINVHQFYGIELSKFSSKIAQISMWMMDHLMNSELSEMFDLPKYRFPLEKKPNIVCGDALEINWNNILPTVQCNYILGNPPFGGSNTITKEQRFQLVQLTNKYKIKTSNLDYVTGWFIKAGEYIQDHTKIGLVSTSSICQGSQVYPLWTILLDKLNMNIIFAHKPFRWGSETKDFAKVAVVIIGLSKQNTAVKHLYNNITVKETPYITPYLNSSKKKRPIVQSSPKPLNNLPSITSSPSPIDYGCYIFTVQEYNDFIKKEPNAEKYMRPYLDGKDFINGGVRYILVLQDVEPVILHKMPLVMDRINKVKQYRLMGKSKSTKDIAKTPTRFRGGQIPTKPYLYIPNTSSEKRNYIPIGYLEPPIIPANPNYIIYNAKKSLFALLTSRMHNVWARAIGGKLETRLRYSNTLCYNTFPVPKSDLKSLEPSAQEILDIRAKYPDSSLADLYDPDTMPTDLLKAHKTLDKAVESLYRKEPFTDDDDRLEFLLEEYEKLVGKQKKL